MAKTKDTPLAYNIDTGVVVFRNSESDAQCNCVPIKREHAAMLERGEISTKALSAAIKSHLKEKRDFDFDKYIEERRKLNVRKAALKIGEPDAALKNRNDELLSDAEIAAAKTADAEPEEPAAPASPTDDIVAEAIAATAAPAAEPEAPVATPPVDPAFID